MSVLHIEIDGDSSIVDSVIKETSLPIYQSYKVGEKHKYRKNKIFNVNMVSCDVSNKDWDNFKGHIDDIEMFLTKYKKDIKYLLNKYDKIELTIDLPYECILSDSIVNQNNFIPANVLLALGELRIDLNLSLY